MKATLAINGGRLIGRYPAPIVPFLNNQVNYKCCLGYIWYLYFNMSVGVVGCDFDYDPGPCL